MCFICVAHVCAAFQSHANWFHVFDVSRACVRVCAQCHGVKCATSVCTCVSLTYTMCYYVPDVFR